MFRSRFVATSGFVAILASATNTLAQTPALGSEEGDRSHRGIVGASFGVGGFRDAGPRCSICPSWSGSGWDGNFVVGTFLAKRHAIELQMSSLTPAEDYNSTFGAFSLEYVFRVGSRSWVRGGYGIGYLERSAERPREFAASRPGGVVSGAVGVELLRTRNWSVDGQAQIKRLSYLDQPGVYASVGIGFHWYPKLPKW